MSILLWLALIPLSVLCTYWNVKDFFKNYAKGDCVAVFDAYLTFCFGFYSVYLTVKVINGLRSL